MKKQIIPASHLRLLSDQKSFILEAWPFAKNLHKTNHFLNRANTLRARFVINNNFCFNKYSIISPGNEAQPHAWGKLIVPNAYWGLFISCAIFLCSFAISLYSFAASSYFLERFVQCLAIPGKGLLLSLYASAIEV